MCWMCSSYDMSRTQEFAHYKHVYDDDVTEVNNCSIISSGG